MDRIPRRRFRAHSRAVVQSGGVRVVAGKGVCPPAATEAVADMHRSLALLVRLERRSDSGRCRALVVRLLSAFTAGAARSGWGGIHELALDLGYPFAVKLHEPQRVGVAES
jgi:hypothetical protein